jgi:hypothetical protein
LRGAAEGNGDYWRMSKKFRWRAHKSVTMIDTIASASSLQELSLGEAPTLTGLQRKRRIK